MEIPLTTIYEYELAEDAERRLMAIFEFLLDEDND